MDRKNHGKFVRKSGVTPEIKIRHLSGTSPEGFQRNNLLDKWQRICKERVVAWRETPVGMYRKILRETTVNTRLRDLKSNSSGVVKNGNNFNTLAVNSFAAQWEGPHKTAIWSDSFNHSFSAHHFTQGSALRPTDFRAAQARSVNTISQVRTIYKSDKHSGSKGQTGELEAVYWGHL
jgi:hypothetical protein